MAEELRPGLILGSSLYLPGTRIPLLRPGTCLTAKMIAKIDRLKLGEQAMDCLGGTPKRVEKPRSIGYPEPMKPFLTRSEHAGLKAVMGGLSSQVALWRMIYGLSRRLESFDPTYEIRVVEPELGNHAINVFTLSLAIGQAMGYTPRQLGCLGTGALFHDLGQDLLPDQITGKSGPLSPEETSMVRHHPVLAVGMLGRALAFSRWTFSQDALDIVQFHHERLDGSGYPKGLRGSEISQMAMICAVADIYDAMISDSVYSRRKPPALAYQTIKSMACRQLDGAVVGAFLQRIRPYPTGTDVVLSDTRIGRVLRSPASSPLRPVIVVGQTEINLAEDRRLDIVSVAVGPGSTLMSRTGGASS